MANTDVTNKTKENKVTYNKHKSNNNVLMNILISMRPKQWLKNMFVFAGLVFSKSFLHRESLLKSLAAFVLFCIVSGVVYIINDIADRENDAVHPRKKNRPIANGSLSLRTALITAGVMLVAALLAAWFLDVLFFVVLIGYFLLVCAYSFILKHVVIIDVLALALGFVLRTVGGTVVINVLISPWLLLCTLLLALFLGLNKRRGEIVALAEGATEHRQILGEYSLPLVDHMLSVITSTTLISYSLYTFSAGNSLMMITIPFVLYGFFRYQYLVQKKDMGESPELTLLADKPLLVSILLWLTVSVVIVLLQH